MDTPVAHKIDAKERTDDVRVKEVSPFSKMLLTDAVRKGLHQAGFVYPTIIQATAIPVGKSGMDLLVQSKSGTGKTLIFCTILLEAYRADRREPQSLIVVPTREIAVQIESVLNQIGRYCHGFRAVCVIGGLDITDDRKRLQGAKAVVGTPGRLLHLIQNNVLNTSRMTLLILDEADKMYTQSFRQDLLRIQRALPAKRQTIACSATFCDNLDEEIAKIMRNPLLISTQERASLLVGIKQFSYELPEQKTSILEMDAKLDALKDIFGRIAFKQCLIFAGSQSRADSYRNYLEHQGWPCELISGAQDQKMRLEMFHKFREFKTRILIATDLMSRGIDSEHVNLVINLELPTDVVTYLHRIGRAGRFGSHGIAINFIASEKDRALFRRLICQVGNGMQVLKFPQAAVTKVDVGEQRDIWDFSDFSAECEHYGCFGMEHVAPLASQEPDSFAVSLEANKENMSDNKSQNGFGSNSSIDTKTFQIDSTGINLLDLLIDRPEYVTQAGQKLTPDSRQSSSQRLPSSNTIDDASSIAADSIRSSQQDVSRYQSILMQKAAIPTLVEFLVDQRSEECSVKGEEGLAKKSQIDFFEDYKKALQQEEKTESQSSEPKPQTKMLTKNFKSLLIDQPTSKQNEDSTPLKDIFSDYANFDGEEASTSNSQATAASESIDKATFILSVATPSQVRESIEELHNSSLDLSLVDSMADTQSLPEVQHFPSPVHNQPIPDVVPPDATGKGQPIHAAMQKLTVNVGAQVEILPHLPVGLPNAPLAPSQRALHSPNSVETLSSGEHDNVSGSASSSNTARGGSSGFDEHASSSTSSGIETSEEEEAFEAYDSNSDDDEDDDEEENYFDDEVEENYAEQDEIELCDNDDEDGDDDDDDEEENYFDDENDDIDDEEENYFDNDEIENYFDFEVDQNYNESDDDEEENYFADDVLEHTLVPEANTEEETSVNDDKEAETAGTSKHQQASTKQQKTRAKLPRFLNPLPKEQQQPMHADADEACQAQVAAHVAAGVAAGAAAWTATHDQSQNQKGAKNKARSKAKKQTKTSNATNAATDSEQEMAYERWVQIYWQQLTFIQNHVKFSTQVRRQQQQKP